MAPPPGPLPWLAVPMLTGALRYWITSSAMANSVSGMV
jgi:hypothetical protein